MKKIIFLISLCLLSIKTFSQVGINTKNPKGALHIDAKGDNPTSGTVGVTEQKDDVVILPNGNVAIGSNNSNDYSKLDIQSNNQGILIPRVNLTSSTLDLNADGDSKVSNQPTGLMVFNIGTTLPKGFYFWNGIEWRSLDNKPFISPTASLLCESGTVFPATFTSGTPYNGTLTIPYTNGNGGTYPALGAGSFIRNGLTFKMNPGTLTYGDGTITYTITGTPNFSSPNTAVIPINALGSTGNVCNVTIGDNSSKFEVGQTKTAKIVIPAADFENFREAGSANIMTGKALTNQSTVTNRTQAYRLASDAQKAEFIIINGLRMDFIQSWLNSTNVSPKLFNTFLVKNVNYSISSISTDDSYLNGSNTAIAPQYYSFNIEGNDNMGCTPNNQSEYVNAMITFEENEEWYNCTWYASRDANNYYFYFTAQRLN